MYVWVYFWAFDSVPLVYVSVFIIVALLYRLKSRSVMPSVLFFHRISLAIKVFCGSTYVFGVLFFPTSIKCHWNLDGGCINL